MQGFLLLPSLVPGADDVLVVDGVAAYVNQSVVTGPVFMKTLELREQQVFVLC